jgi:hypothetical protein
MWLFSSVATSTPAWFSAEVKPGWPQNVNVSPASSGQPAISGASRLITVTSAAEVISFVAATV